MLRPDKIALIVLAAGLSSRFGHGHKLEQDLFGKPVGLHAVETLAPLSFAARIAVIGPSAPDYARSDYQVVTNPNPAAGMSGSIALGLAAASSARIEAALIILADMPFVTESHVCRILQAYGPQHTIVASLASGRAMPPALFGRAHFGRLMSLSGDAGARNLLRQAKQVPAPPETLIDIDTPAQLETARARLKSLRR